MPVAKSDLERVARCGRCNHSSSIAPRARRGLSFGETTESHYGPAVTLFGSRTALAANRQIARADGAKQILSPSWPHSAYSRCRALRKGRAGPRPAGRLLARVPGALADRAYPARSGATGTVVTPPAINDDLTLALAGRAALTSTSAIWKSRSVRPGVCASGRRA